MNLAPLLRADTNTLLHTRTWLALPTLEQASLYTRTMGKKVQNSMIAENMRLSDWCVQNKNNQVLHRNIFLKFSWFCTIKDLYPHA